ncbi:MAG: tyrosine-type recombinase/integrase, partial [Candidatus Methylumidiphilus sp.]
ALIKVPAAASVVTYQTGVVPLEQFVLPEAYNGANGENRSPDTPFIPASDDYQAIFCWLARLDPDSHTYRSYRREAERLLLWTILVQQKALSSLNVVDLSEYRSFLGDPQPHALWIGSPQKKGHAHWKPFTGPLSLRSRRFSETVLNGLFTFLASQRYLAHNPLLALPKLKDPNSQQPLDINRSFTESQWQLITAFLDNRVAASSGPEQLKWLRTRLIVQLGYGTGLRLHEMAQATLGDLAGKQRQGKIQYWLAVLGKGQKMREVPVPFPLYLLLTESYQQLTGRQLNRPSPDYPLIPPLRGSESKPLTPLALHKILKQAFALAAEDLANEQPETAEKLQYASAHWLRHTHGSTAVDRNIPLTMIRDNLGHSSIATTSHYVHADKDARHEAFSEGFSGK